MFLTVPLASFEILLWSVSQIDQILCRIFIVYVDEHWCSSLGQNIQALVLEMLWEFSEDMNSVVVFPSLCLCDIAVCITHL